ncbi:MAG: DUF4013 domain-containing protein [Actinobacteria bacterium]|nr:DUF4013 domain-containing protein [Actinomycetota bacterium]
MNYSQAFSYVLQDPNWLKKVLIGGLLTLFSFLLIPIVPLMGYYVRVLQNVAGGVDPVLPEWDDWNGFFTTGIKALIVALAYGLVIGIIVGIIQSVSSALGSIFNILYYFVIPVVFMRFSRNEEIGDAFKFNQMIELAKANPSDYVVSVLLAFAASLLAMVGLIGLLIGAAFTLFYALLVNAGIFGQYLRLYGGDAPSENVSTTSPRA